MPPDQMDGINFPKTNQMCVFDEKEKKYEMKVASAVQCSALVKKTCLLHLRLKIENQNLQNKLKNQMKTMCLVNHMNGKQVNEVYVNVRVKFAFFILFFSLEKRKITEHN